MPPTLFFNYFYLLNYSVNQRRVNSFSSKGYPMKRDLLVLVKAMQKALAGTVITEDDLFSPQRNYYGNTHDTAYSNVALNSQNFKVKLIWREITKSRFAGF